MVTLGSSSLSDPFAEQYKAVRTNLMFSRLDREMRTIVLTSTTPGEGKTTIACNLAVVIAQAGHRVILVDADFRKPAVHRIFGTSRKIGLGNLLLGDAGEDEALLDSGVPNLQLLATGPIPPNPSELLGSKSMQRVITRLSQRADIVLIDSPPASAVTDPTVIAALVDGVIVVVERGSTGVPAIIRTLSTLEGVGATLIGVVLNKVRSGDNGLDYYYAYGEGPDTENSTPPPPAGTKGAPSPPTETKVVVAKTEKAAG
jgi:capsular exopolysaccharide synthesis family protein